MQLSIVRSNRLLLCGTQDNEARIQKKPDLLDGVVMELVAPCRG